MKKITSSILFFSIVLISFSQPSISWQKTLGGSGSEIAKDVIQNSDGDFITVGYTASNDGDVSTNSGNFDGWITKVSPTGTLIWEYTFGGSENDLFFDVNQTADGGYIIAGSTLSNNGDIIGNNGNADAWVVKLTSAGILEWSTVYGGYWDENGNAIQQTSDGGYILVGDASSDDGDVSGNNSQGFQNFPDFWIVKLTSTGAITWERNYGSTMFDWATDVKQTSDGGYIVLGQISIANVDVYQAFGGNDIWVIKLDDQGNIGMQTTLGGSSEDYSKKIFPTADGGYIIGGSSQSSDGMVNNNHGDQDFWVVKINSAGTVLWNESYGGTAYDNLRGMAQTTNDGFVLTGVTFSANGDVTSSQGASDVWAIEIDSLGVIQWQKTVGGTSHEYGESVIQTTDGGFIMAGFTESNDGDITVNQGQSDVWLVKFAGSSNAEIIEPSLIITLSPNPTNSILTIKLSTPVTLQIITSDGKILATLSAASVYQYDVNNLENGIYFIQTESGKTQKFIKK